MGLTPARFAQALLVGVVLGLLGDGFSLEWWALVFGVSALNAFLVVAVQKGH